MRVYRPTADYYDDDDGCLLDEIFPCRWKRRMIMYEIRKTSHLLGGLGPSSSSSLSCEKQGWGPIVDCAPLRVWVNKCCQLMDFFLLTWWNPGIDQSGSTSLGGVPAGGPYARILYLNCSLLPASPGRCHRRSFVGDDPNLPFLFPPWGDQTTNLLSLNGGDAVLPPIWSSNGCLLLRRWSGGWVILSRRRASKAHKTKRCFHLWRTNVFMIIFIEKSIENKKLAVGGGEESEISGWKDDQWLKVGNCEDGWLQQSGAICNECSLHCETRGKTERVWVAGSFKGKR